MTKAHFEIYGDDEGDVRWRLRAANGEIVAVSEGYTSLTAAVESIDTVRELVGVAEVEDLYTED